MQVSDMASRGILGPKWVRAFRGVSGPKWVRVELRQL